MSLARYLTRSGFDVVPVASTEEAFDALRQTHIDGFVLDARLPAHRSGLDVLECVRLDDDEPNRPVVILTGYELGPDEEDVVRRFRAYVFYKPANYEELIQKMRTLLAVLPSE